MNYSRANDDESSDDEHAEDDCQQEEICLFPSQFRKLDMLEKRYDECNNDSGSDSRNHVGLSVQKKESPPNKSIVFNRPKSSG